jgi:hypothetical protein
MGERGTGEEEGKTHMGLSGVTIPLDSFHHLLSIYLPIYYGSQFEIRASRLLGRYSTIWTTLPTLFFADFFFFTPDIGSHKLFARAGFELWSSWVARIIGVSHQHLALSILFISYSNFTNFKSIKRTKLEYVNKSSFVKNKIRLHIGVKWRMSSCSSVADLVFSIHKALARFNHQHQNKLT